MNLKLLRKKRKGFSQFRLRERQAFRVHLAFKNFINTTRINLVFCSDLPNFESTSPLNPNIDRVLN